MFKNRVLLVGLVAMVLASLMLGAMAEHQPGIESHYHYRMAGEIASGDLRPSPGEHLPLGPLASDYPVDHHWGLHLLMVPLTWLGDIYEDDYVGLKLGSVFFFMFTILGFYWVLQRFRIPYASVLCLCPLAFEALGWRYLQLRGGGLMAVGILYWAYCTFWLHKALRSTLMAYFLMISYQGAFLMLPLCIAGVAGSLMVEKRSFQEKVQPLKWTLLGIVAGLFAGPYLWQSFSFLLFHLNTAFGDPGGYYSTGHEFSPLTWSMVQGAPEYLFLAVLLIGTAMVSFKHRKELDPRVMSFVAMSLALLLLSVRSMRILEYAVPFGILTIALVALGRSYRMKPYLQVVAVLLVAIFIARRLDQTITMGQDRTPTGAYDEMASMLQAEEGIIGNLFQADFSLILWAAPEAKCVQGLNHYFVHEDIRIALDRLKMKGQRYYRPIEDKGNIMSSLKTLVKSGVTLFTARPSRGDWSHPMVQFAQSNPDVLTPVFPESLKLQRWSQAADSFVWAWRPGPSLSVQ